MSSNEDMKKLFGYEGKTVVVSGAFSGMGLAAVKLLTELGAKVYVICRRNGRHSEMPYPVEGVLYGDFGKKEDLDYLAAELEKLPEVLYGTETISYKYMIR